MSDQYAAIAPIYDLIIEPIMHGVRKEAAAIVGNASVLDVACGTGAQLRTYKKGIGIDMSVAMLKKAHGLSVVHGDARHLPFKRGEFAYASISLALHEMPPKVREQVVKEMHRVAQKVIIIDYARPRGFFGLLIWIAERIMGGAHYKNFKQFVKQGGARAYMKKPTTEKRFLGGSVVLLVSG